MAAGMGVLVRVLAAVDQEPGVCVLSVRASCTEIRDSGAWHPAVDVEVHADGHASATLLGDRWGLAEELPQVRGLPGGYRSEWRTWAGWVPELATGERRVWLRVTGAEPVDPDPDDAPSEPRSLGMMRLVVNGAGS